MAGYTVGSRSHDWMRGDVAAGAGLRGLTSCGWLASPRVTCSAARFGVSTGQREPVLCMIHSRAFEATGLRVAAHAVPGRRGDGMARSVTIPTGARRSATRHPRMLVALDARQIRVLAFELDFGVLGMLQSPVSEHLTL